jgi:hypothetical protein
MSNTTHETGGHDLRSVWWAKIILPLLGVLLIQQSYGRDGCIAVGAGRGRGFTQSQRLTPNNESCARLLAEETLWQRRMNVTAELFLCDAENAFAEPSGQVYLGQPLINTLIARSGPVFAFQAAGFVCAHEFSHEFQFRILGQRGKQLVGGPQLELQADMLGGYWVGMRLREQKEALENAGLFGEVEKISTIAKKMAYDLGDFVFNSPQHHGTPTERHRAVSTGLDAGFKSKFGSADEAFDDHGDTIFDWSAGEVARILGVTSSSTTKVTRKPNNPDHTASGQTHSTEAENTESSTEHVDDHGLEKFLGLKYGATEEDVLAKFGEPEGPKSDLDVNGNKEWFYFDGNLRIVINENNPGKGKVRLIEVAEGAIKPLFELKHMAVSYFHLVRVPHATWEDEFGKPTFKNSDSEGFRLSPHVGVTLDSQQEFIRVSWHYE